MPYSISIRADRDLAIFTFSGKVCTSQAKQAFLDYVAMDGFDPRYVMLSDAREVTQIDAQFFEIYANIQGLSKPLKKFERGALSVVLVSDDLVFGMTRMLEQVLELFSGIKMRVTRSEANALELCGLSDISFDALTPKGPGHDARQI